MNLLLILTIINLVLSDPITDNAKRIMEKMCPYNGLYGSLCSTKQLDKINKLPVLLGVGWDPVKGEIRLPLLNVTYSNKIYQSINGENFVIPNEYKLIKQNLTQNNFNTVTYHYPSEFFNDINLNRSGSKSFPNTVLAV